MEFESRFLNTAHSCHIPRRRNLYKNLSPRKKFFFKLAIVSEKHPNHRKYLLCDNDVYFEKYRQISANLWYVMHPFSILAAFWDIFMSVFYILNLYNVPFWKSDTKTLTTFTQYFILLYLVKQFFTGYVDVEDMLIVINQKQIAVHYLYGWFALDFMGSFSWSDIVIKICSHVGYDLDQNTRYHLGALDITSILQIRLLIKSIRSSADYFIKKESMKRLFLLLCYVAIAVHWMACMTVFVPLCVHGDKLNDTKSWLARENQNKSVKPLDLSHPELYMEALSRTLMQLMSLGLGGPNPRTKEDIFIVIVVVVLGRLLFFYIIEEALSINNWVRSATIKFHILKNLARGCLEKRQVPQIVRDKVELFYHRKMRGAPNQMGLMGMLSSSLREELQKYDTMRVVKGSPILRSLQPTTLERVARFLKQEVFLPNEALTRLGGPVDCVYFLESGTVALYERNGQESCHLTDGTCFGTLEFVSGHERRVLSIVAIEVCDVYRLNGDEFNRLLRLEPQLRTTLRTMSEKRLGHQIERGLEASVMVM